MVSVNDAAKKRYLSAILGGVFFLAFSSYAVVSIHHVANGKPVEAKQVSGTKQVVRTDRFVYIVVPPTQWQETPKIEQVPSGKFAPEALAKIPKADQKAIGMDSKGRYIVE